MLPSKGYFSNLVCPYNGPCTRPYCHYRHRQEDTIAVEDKVDENLNRLVKETVNKVLLANKLATGISQIDKDRIIENVMKEMEENTTAYDKTVNFVPHYQPTPISELNKKHIPVAIPPAKPTYSKSVRPKRQQVGEENKITYSEKCQTLRYPFTLSLEVNQIDHFLKNNIQKNQVGPRYVSDIHPLSSQFKQETVNDESIYHINSNVTGVYKEVNIPTYYRLPTSEVQTDPISKIPISSFDKLEEEKRGAEYGSMGVNELSNISSLDNIKEKKLCSIPQSREGSPMSQKSPIDREKRKIISKVESHKKIKLENPQIVKSIEEREPVWKPPKHKDKDHEVFSNEEFPPLKSLKCSTVRTPTSNDPLCDKWRRAHEIISLKRSSSQQMKIHPVSNIQMYLSPKDTSPKRSIANSNHSHVNSAVTLSSEERYLNEGTPVLRTSVRKAHVSGIKTVQYPSVLFDSESKIPYSVRQTCLNKMYDEFAKHVNEELSKKNAQKMELEISKRIYTIKPYRNAIALALLRIRKQKGDISDNIKPLVIFKSDSIPKFTNGWTLYSCFMQYILNENEYKINGFPIKLQGKIGCAYIEVSARRKKTTKLADACQRNCEHCSKTYFVNVDGYPAKEYDCSYHWGKLRRLRVYGNTVERYSCCDGEVDSEPCTTGRYHVCNGFNEDSLEGFVSTRPQNPWDVADKAGVFGLDCEMCYTTEGIELTRCTLVDLNGNTVYDRVVSPDAPIIDYCTRFSGITEDMMKGITVKLNDIQNDILNMVNEKTILVGHSLENDLKVLKIFHRTLVDTSVVFPHIRGLPYKNSLKRIAKDLINLSIQEGENGHDSYEDANACVQLMLWKIREDAKRRKPRIIISLEKK